MSPISKEDRELLLETLKQVKDGVEKIITPPETAVRLLQETCARTGLDWKLRHVYLVNRGGKWSVTLSIDGFRLIANQDPEYNGQAGPFWTLGPDQPWTDIPPAKKPYAARVGVYRKGQSEPTWGVAKFDDYNARSPMWSKFESTMIAKCAEMLALRKALPGKLGGLYGVEEMDQAGRARNSVPNSTSVPVPEVTVSDESVWATELTAATTEEGLVLIGADIQKSGLDTTVKLRLSKLYKQRKDAIREKSK